jgi:hypothetical protein
VSELSCHLFFFNLEPDEDALAADDEIVLRHACSCGTSWLRLMLLPGFRLRASQRLYRINKRFQDCFQTREFSHHFDTRVLARLNVRDATSLERHSPPVSQRAASVHASPSAKGSPPRPERNKARRKGHKSAAASTVPSVR